MSWNPNQGQDPNQPNQYGGYVPPQQGIPGEGQPPYGQPGGYQQPGQQPGYQQPGYQQPGYQQPGYQQPGYQQPGGYQQGGYSQQPPYGAPPRVSSLGPSSIGMDPNISAGLGYLIPLVGLIFFFIEKQNRFVRFHTLQSVLLAVSGFVLFFVLLFVGIALALVSSNLGGLILGLGYILIPIGLFIGWLIAMINAFQGKIFKLPLIGDLAERWSSSGITAM
jgi:uncharacterized membrane protein